MSSSVTLTFIQLLLLALVPAALTGTVGILAGLVGPWFLENRKQAAEQKKKRAEKFEELVAAVVEHGLWLDAMRTFTISGQGSAPPLSPMMKIEAITTTYFPECDALVRQFETVSNNYRIWTYDMGQKRVRNEAGYEQLMGHDDVLKKYMDKRAEFLIELKRFARREFQ